MMDSLFPDYVPAERKGTGPKACRVYIVPAGAAITVDAGTLLLDAARSAGVDVAQQCGGFAIFSWCRMRVIDGAEHLSSVGPEEERLFEWGKLREGERASCQAEVLGDVTVEPAP